MTRVVSLDDSRAFAALSGDFNPLHVDPIAARRLAFGGTVVHGIHTLLAALDDTLAGAATPQRLTSLKAVFTAPITTGTPFTTTTTKRDDNGTTLTVATATGPAQQVTFAFEPATGDDGAPLDARAWEPEAPREIAFDDATGGAVPLRLDRTLLQRLFPNVAARLAAQQVATILATTRIVGMECPGLHSVFADLALTFTRALRQAQDDGGRARDDGGDALTYTIARAQKRFRMITFALDGPGTSGQIGALFRAAPVAQPSFADVRARLALPLADVASNPVDVASNPVILSLSKGRRALVVGGSRGLGEVLAKVVAAGGGEVVVTYHRGRDDAQRVADEIAAGGGVAYVAHSDVETGETDLLDHVPQGWTPTDVYYFSTPRIALNRGPWNPALFAAFCRHYVDGFAALVEATERDFPSPSGAIRRYVYPSTVYVEETPPGLAEYAAAKAAGETLCRALAERRKTISVAVTRLPRLFTDQTGADDAANLPSAVEVLTALARGG
ncbi:MAG: SDR family NAD(P)-dependent oxidoreductase [Candidatus Eremiobacteraeota bacterium]|nr:SDR family NAD(P)-dependent oxidoreductase [Candidatus Eremiobacteraeota bacterium]